MILIKKIYLISIAIFFPIILFLALKQGAPLAIAEPSNIAKPVVKSNLKNAKSGVKPQKVNPVSSTSITRHIVGNGESLYLIAQKYKVTVQSLMNANGLKSTSIYPGQTLKIPARNSSASKAPKVNPGSPASIKKHVVGNGESLYLIAQKYKVTVQSLMNANGLKSTSIYPGQTLKIPAGNSATPKENGSVSGPQKPAGSSQKPAGSSQDNNPPEENKPNSGNPWLIKVSKYDHTLTVLYQGQEYRSYHVELGDNGLGAKMVAGDHKTPEGTYYITEKSVLNPEDEFLGTRWMRLSYPNIAAAQRGLQDGIIDHETYNEIVTANNEGRTPPQGTALGGGVGIHGGDKPEFNHDWTWGCVGLANKDIETFFDKIPVGTTVIIQK